MRLRSVLLIGPCLPLVGCNQFQLAGHNLANETISFGDERKFDHRLESEARCVWQDVCRQYPARTFTPEFADGFTDGYVDYLDVGGTPQPPAIPPLRYRRSSYLSPHGRSLVNDYLVGFQYGVEVAVATGKREFLTVPVLLGEVPPSGPLNVTRLPAPPEASLDPVSSPTNGAVPPVGVPIAPAVPVAPAIMGPPTPPPSVEPVPVPMVPRTPMPVPPRTPTPSVPSPAPVPPPPGDSSEGQVPPSKITTPLEALPAGLSRVVLPPVAEPPAGLPPVPDPIR